MSEPVLQVSDLEKHFQQDAGLLNRVLGRDQKTVRAVDGITFDLEQNEVIGVIGESGCGKSTLMMTLVGLYDKSGGEILYKGREIASFDKTERKTFLGDVQFIFQDPFNSLDPKLTVRESLYEPLKIHNMDDRENRVHRVLEQVELQPPERYLDRLPSQLSGGEKQRVCIARALVVEPEVILADEPVSMLDVSTQASILNLLSELINEYDVSMLYVSHDLSTVSYVCDRINVMYLGRIVESAPVDELIDAPKHPYTHELVKAIPIPDPHHERTRTEISGAAPDPIDLPSGCRFKDRCPDRMEICDQRPAFVDTDGETQHRAACHLYYDHDSDPHPEQIEPSGNGRTRASDGGEREEQDE